MGLSSQHADGYESPTADDSPEQTDGDEDIGGRARRDGVAACLVAMAPAAILRRGEPDIADNSRRLLRRKVWVSAIRHGGCEAAGPGPQRAPGSVNDSVSDGSVNGNVDNRVNNRDNGVNNGGRCHCQQLREVLPRVRQATPGPAVSQPRKGLRRDAGWPRDGPWLRARARAGAGHGRAVQQIHGHDGQGQQAPGARQAFEAEAAGRPHLRRAHGPERGLPAAGLLARLGAARAGVPAGVQGGWPDEASQAGP
mmetsp:Transcript_11933/g.31553  ORF Transcript_11933/g.31553 Transcript_11933/m.31553 type:complete len:253 (-) Transcript_11933:1007-1765(-)